LTKRYGTLMAKNWWNMQKKYYLDE
jgi:hypothetical protein